jgi:hypothetical protein
MARATPHSNGVRRLRSPATSCAAPTKSRNSCSDQRPTAGASTISSNATRYRSAGWVPASARAKACSCNGSRPKNAHPPDRASRTLRDLVHKSPAIPVDRPTAPQPQTAGDKNRTIWLRLPRRTSSQVRSHDGLNSGTSRSTSRLSAANPGAISPVMLPRGVRFGRPKKLSAHHVGRRLIGSMRVKPSPRWRALVRSRPLDRVSPQA